MVISGARGLFISLFHETKAWVERLKAADVTDEEREQARALKEKMTKLHEQNAPGAANFLGTPPCCSYMHHCWLEVWKYI